MLSCNNLVFKNKVHISEFVNKIIGSLDKKKLDLKNVIKIIEKLDYKIIDDPNKIKGDIWEIIGECFLTYFKSDYIDYTEYSINKKEDFGVDATAKNFNGVDTVIQHKYRSDYLGNSNIGMLVYADIAKTFTQGIRDFKYELTDKNTIVLFTNVKEDKKISRKIKEYFGDVVKIIDYDIIDKHIKNNKNFWNYFYKETIEENKTIFE